MEVIVPCPTRFNLLHEECPLEEFILESDMFRPLKHIQIRSIERGSVAQAL